MAFITAETRSDLIALAVGMLNQAPSNTLLEELIALSVEGGSLADAADHIAKTDAFKAEYPSFQTAEQYATELFDNITTGGTVTAEIRTAVIELATGFLTSGAYSKSGLALAIVDFLSQPAALLNDDFADIAQSVQNRSAAAEYFVVTKELGGSTDAELAAAVARSPVEQYKRQTRWQLRGFFGGAVVIGHEVHRAFVDFIQQQAGDARQPGFGVTHGGGAVAVAAAKVALSVDQRVALRKILRHAHQGVVGRLIAVRVKPAQHVAHHARAFYWARRAAAAHPKPHALHGIKQTALHGFLAVAAVG